MKNPFISPRCLHLLAATILCCAATLHIDAVEPSGIFEALPDSLIERVRAADHPIVRSGEMVPFSVVTRLKKWRPGQVLRVGFFGGSPSLHKQIAEIASEWTASANLAFDFGLDPGTGRYRTMAPHTEAEIRISFDQRGFWSLVGTDSVNPRIVGMDEPSMNLHGFDTSPPDPVEFRRVVLHEFGHALGFEHEHQNPEGGCDNEFDWRAVTRYLKGPPNHWSDAQIEFNLRQLRDSTPYESSPPDPESIMFYSFEPWMFVKGTESACYVRKNTALSAGDLAGVAAAYPRDAAVRLASFARQVTETLAQPRFVDLEARVLLAEKLEQLK